MMVREVAATEPYIRHIVENLRPRDKTEIYALRWDNNPETLVRDIVLVAGAMWRVWLVDEVPASIVGMTPVRPGVVSAGAFGTAMWPYTVKHMLRWGRTWCYPALRASGYHRGECYALRSNEDGRRFIEACGGEIEALLHGYGRKKEDFLLYSWRLDDVPKLTKARPSKKAALLEKRRDDRSGRSGSAAVCH